MGKTYYHITTADRYEMIKRFGNIVGSNSNNRSTLGDMSYDGYLYMLNSDNKEIWNGISNTMIFEDSRFDIFGRHSKPFIALAIDEESFISRGLEVIHDSNTDTNENTLTPYCVSVKLGEHKIPIEEIKYIGTYNTNSDIWESKTRFDLTKLHNPDVNMEDIVINTYPLGRVEYKDRKKYTTNKVFFSKQLRVKFIKKNIHPNKEIALDASRF